MTRLPIALLVLVTALSVRGAAAQDVSLQTRTQLSTLLTAAPDTPGGQGLLTVALAEARAAASEASAAGRAPADLAGMQQHAGAVLAALDPALTNSTTGRYGVRPAVQALVQQLTALRSADTKPDAARTAPAALTAALNVLRWCDVAIDLAQRLRAATSAADAVPLAQPLMTVTRQLAVGASLGQARITSASEGGLLYVQLQLRMLQVGRDAAAAAPPTVATATPGTILGEPRPPIPLGSAAGSPTQVSR
jgi:hypothetical protein